MRDRRAVHALLLVILFLLLVAGSLPLLAQSNPEILPTGLDFGYMRSGKNAVQTVSVYNISSGANVTVNSITPSITQLRVVRGTLPITLAPGQRADYSIQFTPDSAASFAGHLTFALAGKPSQAVNVTGVGTSAT